MNWNNSKSILLSRIAIIVFAIILLLLDIFMNPFLDWYMGLRRMTSQGIKTAMMITAYVSSAFAWLILFDLMLLLRNLKKGQVFVEQNVTALRIVSLSFIAISIACFIGGFFYLPFFIVSGAAIFMSLIVQIVKNAFAEAVRMKTELDLTI